MEPAATNAHAAEDDEAEDDDSCAPAEEDVLDTRNKFNRYVRGLCVVCHEGSVDQMLGVLFRAYSVARDDGTITRNEMASILAKHVVYEDAEVRPALFLPSTNSQ